jgi:hypothetical protein
MALQHKQESELSKKKNQAPPEKFVAIEDMCTNYLGILADDLKKWATEDRLEIKNDPHGRECIPCSCIERYSVAPNYPDAALRAVLHQSDLRDARDETTNRRLRDARIELIGHFDEYIGVLEAIHRKHLNSVNAHGNESSMMAAYLLFARAISTLKMCCLCQSHGFWYSGSLLREVNECLTTAEYLVVGESSSNGRRSLLKWFRQNEAPGHGEGRRTLSVDMAQRVPWLSATENSDLMYELYNKQSKFTHPTYLTIREVTKYKRSPEGNAVLEQMDYGVCSDEGNLLELTKALGEEILTTVLAFQKCFLVLPLTPEDVISLKSLRQQLLEEVERDFSAEE